MKSELHRRNVAALPCAQCGIESYSQCAHSNSYAFGKGLGLKSSDLATFPLCCARPGVPGCHQTHDLLLGITGEEAHSREPGYIFSTLLALAADGKLKAVK